MDGDGCSVLLRDRRNVLISLKIEPPYKIYSNLPELMNEMGITSAGLVLLTGLSPAIIQTARTNLSQCSLSILRCIAEVLGVDVLDLFGDDNIDE